MKLKKIAIAALAAMTMATGAMGITASANTVSSSCGSFTWTTSSAKTTNITNTSRLVTATFTVYADNTGTWITNKTSRQSGAYGTVATASNPGYSSSGYNFACSGSVYNSTNDASGTAWYTGQKYLD